MLRDVTGFGRMSEELWLDGTSRDIILSSLDGVKNQDLLTDASTGAGCMGTCVSLWLASSALTPHALETVFTAGDKPHEVCASC